LTFLPEFHADLSRYKEMRRHCIPYRKHPPFSLCCAPSTQDAQILTRDMSSAYVCL